MNNWQRSSNKSLVPSIAGLIVGRTETDKPMIVSARAS
jgi:hypothetical protein